MRILGRRIWLIHLATLGACGFFAASAAATFLASNLEPAPVVPDRHATPRPYPADSPRDVRAVVSRNLFCSTCAPVTAAEEPVTPSGEPVRSELPLRLVATLLSPDERWSFAALHGADGRTRLVGVGGSVAEGVVLDWVDERRIFLRRPEAERLEYIALDDPASEGAQRGPPVVKAVASDLAAGIRSLGDGKYEIERAVVKRVLSNATLLATCARIVPAVQGGKPAGFMLDHMRAGCVYPLLGMRDRDIVQAVNGNAIRTPDDALAIYTKLANASHVTISFARGGRTITHDYTIR